MTDLQMEEVAAVTPVGGDGSNPEEESTNSEDAVPPPLDSGTDAEREKEEREKDKPEETLGDDNDVAQTNNNDSSFWICGDDWQSIYSFTGASVGNTLNFDKIFSGSKIFILNLNYRSTPQILKACQNLIRHNVKKIEKTLTTNNGDGEEVIVLEASSEEGEALNLINEITELVDRQGYITDEDIPSPDDVKILNLNQLQLSAARYPDSIPEKVSTGNAGIQHESLD